MRQVLSRLKRQVEALLHPSRRKRAIHRIRELGSEPRILVVCTGNICRSPYAEVRLRERLADHPTIRMHVASAGLLNQAGRPSPDEAVNAARTRGIDLQAHRSQGLPPRKLMEADLILVMDDRHQRAVRRSGKVPMSRVVQMGDLDPEPIRVRAVADPYAQPPEAFDECYERIDRCLDTMIEAITSDGDRGADDESRGKEAVRPSLDDGGGSGRSAARSENHPTPDPRPTP